MTKNKIFISHSSKDIVFVRSFVENILQIGLDIPADRIFCSSMEGQGVKSGQYIPDRLRDEIHKASLTLLFVSKNFKTSEVCINEVGAAWVTLSKENIIPLILPNIDFVEIGFLDIGRLGIKIYERTGVLKLIQDCKEKLNPNFNLEKLHNKIDKFINEVSILNDPTIKNSSSDKSKAVDDWEDCFTNNLFSLNSIIRKAIPAQHDGIHQIIDTSLQNKILTDLSKEKFLKSFWYKQAEGDYYVEKLKKLRSGNWLISSFNWEVKISDMWISMNSTPQYEFILIYSEKQEPYKIDSDVGGEDYHVGVLQDGTIISENERLNGYAIINGETIDVNEYNVEPRYRDKKSHWVFLVSSYHKAGYNADETIDFCKELDEGNIEINHENIMEFLGPLRNHPTIVLYN